MESDRQVEAQRQELERMGEDIRRTKQQIARKESRLADTKNDLAEKEAWYRLKFSGAVNNVIIIFENETILAIQWWDTF